MILLTPGPTPVPENIRKAMADVTLHHRTPEFEEIFASAREKSLKLMGMDEVLFLATSGTGAMEACVTNLCAKRALVISSGKFGERFGELATVFGKNPVIIENPWDTAPSAEDIKKALEENSDIDALFIQVCESAGGLRHNVEEIAKVAKEINPEIMVVADGITAVGVEKLDVSNFDGLITGSQKALMLPPGLALIGLSNKAVEKINERSVGYYLNLAKEIKSQRKNTTAYTAATTLIIGLNAMLETLFEDGIDSLYATTEKRHNAAMVAAKAIGLTIYPKTPALAMVTVATPEADKIRKILKTKYSVNVAGGQNHLKGNIFRINNMGLVAPYEMSWALNAVELALDELGIRDYNGEANRVFSKEFCL